MRRLPFRSRLLSPLSFAAVAIVCCSAWSCSDEGPSDDAERRAGRAGRAGAGASDLGGAAGIAGRDGTGGTAGSTSGAGGTNGDIFGSGGAGIVGPGGTTAAGTGGTGGTGGTTAAGTGGTTGGGGQKTCPAICDDGNPCTKDACGSGGQCEYVPVGDGTTCDNGTVCDGLETCQTGVCKVVPGSVPTVDDGDSCTFDACDAKTGVKHTPQPSCTTCTTKADCVQPGTCFAWTCEAGKCKGTPSGESCDDGNGCNGQETCGTDGFCRAGTPPTLSDNDVCTADSCTPATGVVKHIAIPDCVACDSDSDCGKRACNTGICVKNQCVFTAVADETKCGDDDPCNGQERCVAGACVAGTPVKCQTPFCAGDRILGANCDPKKGCVFYEIYCSDTGKACRADEDVCGACDASNPCRDGFTCNAGKCQ